MSDKDLSDFLESALAGSVFDCAKARLGMATMGLWPVRPSVGKTELSSARVMLQYIVVWGAAGAVCLLKSGRTLADLMFRLACCALT